MHPSLIFAAKAVSLPLDRSPVGWFIVNKCKARFLPGYGIKPGILKIIFIYFFPFTTELRCSPRHREFDNEMLEVACQVSVFITAVISLWYNTH
jgi:hypothetical protein